MRRFLGPLLALSMFAGAVVLVYPAVVGAWGPPNFAIGPLVCEGGTCTLTPSNDLRVDGDVRVKNSGKVHANGRTEISFPSDGKTVYCNDARSTCYCVDNTTADKATFYAGDCSSAGAVDITGDLDVTGALGAGSLALGGDLDMQLNDILNTVNNYAEAPTSDVAPQSTLSHSAHSYALGTQTESNYVVSGGEGEMTITVDADGTKEVGVTVTQTCRNVALAALTEGTDFDCAGLGNTVCAANLAVALAAQSGTCVTATSVVAVVYPQPLDDVGYGVSFASANGVGGGTAFVAVNNADGNVVVGSGQLVPPVGGTTTLSINIGGSGEGFSGGSFLNAFQAGTRRWYMGSGAMISATAADSFRFLLLSGSGTVPIFSISDDTDTGLGTAGADQATIIAGGVNAFNCAEAAGTATCTASGPLVASTNITVGGPINEAGANILDLGPDGSPTLTNAAGQGVVFALGTDSQLVIADEGGSGIVLYVSTFQAVTNGAFQWLNRSRFYSSANKKINVTDNATTDFDQLTLGPETNQYPAFYPDGSAGMTIAGGASVTDVVDVTTTGTLACTLPADDHLYLNATTTKHTQTTGVLDVDMAVADGTAGGQVAIDVSSTTPAEGLGAGEAQFAISASITGDAQDDATSVHIVNQVAYTPNGGGGTSYGYYAADTDFDYGFYTTAPSLFAATEFTGDITFAGYIRHHDFTAGALASVGVGAPVSACCGSFCGPGLDHIDELLSKTVEIPDEWEGASDMIIHIHAVPTDSDPLAATEDIDIDFEWRSADPLTETGKTGTAVTLTDTYLQGGAGTECDMILFEATVPYTGGNQPLTAGDDLGIKINRNPGTEANSYSGSIIIYKAELFYTATGKATH